MPDNNVTKLDLTPTSALNIIRELAKESQKVFFTNHARERMSQRNIATSQIFRCLKTGVITEEPFRDPKGNWKLTLESMCAGDLITVAVVLDHNEQGNYILIITTY